MSLASARTRDMDLIRDILLEIEKAPGVVYMSHLEAADRLKGSGTHRIDYHLRLLKDAKLIEAQEMKSLSTVGNWAVQRLTWDGHEFLDTVRDPEIWSKTKKTATEVGTWTFGLLKDVGAAYLKQKAQEILGIPLG